MSRSGIVNVRMVITEEKILSNIEKVHKMINPKSKKQIIQLDDDTYFKDLVEAIKTYLVEYPKKQNFPASVYNAAFDLVEFDTIISLFISYIYLVSSFKTLPNFFSILSEL